MSPEFRDFVAVLELIESDLSSSRRGSTKPSQLREILRCWLKVSFSSATCRLFDWLRLLLPHEDAVRRYDLREYRLGEHLCKIFGWAQVGYVSSSAQSLRKWRESMFDGDLTCGDFGARLEWLRRGEGTPSQLSIQQVNEYLDQLALFSKYSDTNGQRPGTIVPSQPREAILKQLFERSTSIESKWLARIVLRDLRLNMTLNRLMGSIDPLLLACYDARNSLQHASELMEEIWESANLPLQMLAKGSGYASVDAKTHIIQRHVTPKLGVNIAIAKCSKANSTFQVASDFAGQKVSVETKYDGERIQVHWDREQNALTIYNKSKRNATWERRYAHQVIKAGFGAADKTFYDCISHQPRHRPLPIDSIILEGELVTYDEDSKRIDLFGAIRMVEGAGSFVAKDYETGRRHFMVIWFDVLFVNGRSLLHETLSMRRQRLQHIIDCIPNYVALTTQKEFDFSLPRSLIDFRKYYARLISDREEGVIVKSMESVYSPGKEIWTKLKKDYIDGMGDTADFAIIGGVLSDRVSSCFTNGENRLGGLIAAYLVGCLMNKEEILRNENIRPRYRAMMIVENGFTEQATRSFDTMTEISRVRNQKSRLPHLPFDVLFDKSQLPSSSVDYFFPDPYVFELLGGSFVREWSDEFFVLRHPRIKRQRTDIRWKDCVSFQELQDMAEHQWLTPATEAEHRSSLKHLATIDTAQFHQSKKRTKFAFGDAQSESFSSDGTQPLAGHSQENSVSRTSSLILVGDEWSLTMTHYTENAVYFFPDWKIHIPDKDSASLKAENPLKTYEKDLVKMGLLSPDTSHADRRLHTLTALISAMDTSFEDLKCGKTRVGIIFCEAGRVIKLVSEVRRCLQDIDLPRNDSRLLIMSLKALPVFGSWKSSMKIGQKRFDEDVILDDLQQLTFWDSIELS